ncbi:MAG: hypothetical protein ACXACG_14070 [Candidatus Thorarchaeota archaeon]
MVKLNLLMLFKGFVRNYSTLFLGPKDSYSTFTHREVGYWMRLGEMMGFHTRQEKGVKIKGKTRKADLLWYENIREDSVLHLESENWDWEDCIKNRLDPSTEYLVLIAEMDVDSRAKAVKLAQQLVDRSNKVKGMLLIITGGLNDVGDLILYGINVRPSKKIQEIAAFLRATSSGFYYGVLEEEQEMEWECDYCGKEFATLKAAEYHERYECTEKPSKDAE